MLSMHKNVLEEVALAPSSGGAFEITLDGKTLYSKLETGRFPDEMQLVNALMANR